MKLGVAKISGGREYEYAFVGDMVDPIVMLHGYGDSWYSFNGMLEACPEGVSAVAISQRGHGNSDKPATGYSIQEYAKDALEVFDVLGIKRAPIVGHSMGTFIAQEIALMAPSRVSHLCLIAAAATGDNEILRGLTDETKDLPDPVPRAFAHDFQAGTCANPLGPGMSLERIVDESMLVPAHVWHQALLGLIGYRPETNDPDLSAIICPTLIMWGDRDEIFLEGEQKRLARLIKGAKRVDYAGIGHGLQWEKPEEAMRDVLEFLGRD